jgi:hypothetical protein
LSFIIDPNKAEQFIKDFVSQTNNNNHITVCEVATEGPVDTTDNETNATIWKGKGRPTANDEEATAMLLTLRGKYSSKFEDKKTIKSQIWNKIAQELAEAGFNCGIGKEGGERCRQKFANLQKQYLNHLKHVQRTGEEKRDPPPFFSEMHGILGSKDKVAPTNLQDTEEASENDSSTDTATTSTTTSASANAIKNRFSSVKRMKRESGSVLVLNQMKKQHTENQDERRTEFSILQKILEKQIDQRQEMLNLFKVMVETKIGKKGKLPSPSDESDDE